METLRGLHQGYQLGWTSENHLVGLRRLWLGVVVAVVEVVAEEVVVEEVVVAVAVDTEFALAAAEAALVVSAGQVHH